MWGLGGPVQASAGCAREYGGLTCKSMWKLGGTVGAEPRGACAYRGLPSRESSACMSIAGPPWECSGWGAHPGAAAGRARTGAAPSWASAGCGLPRRCGPALAVHVPAAAWRARNSGAILGICEKHVALFSSSGSTSEQAYCTFRQFRASMWHFTAVPEKQFAFFSSSLTASRTFYQFRQRIVALFSSSAQALRTFRQF